MDFRGMSKHLLHPKADRRAVRLNQFGWVALILAFMTTPAIANALDLTEARVLEMALEKNLGVKIAQTESEIGETGIQESKSVFDAFLEANVDHLLDKSDVATTVFGTENRQTRFNFGVSKVLPSGTRAKLEWNNQRDSTDSPFATLNPFYESALVFSIEQPLLKNMFGKQDRGGVNVARESYKSTDALSQRRISEAVFSVLIDYWRWITNRGVVAVTRRSVAEARKFEDISKQKEEYGLHESTDVLAAKANRLRFETLLTNAKRNRDNSISRIRRGLDLDPSTQLSSKENVPFGKSKPSLEDSLSIALEKRADYLSVKHLLEVRKIELALAKNRKWPELDLVASLQLNGIDGSYGESLSETVTADHPQYFIGAAFRYPIENRNARSQARRAELEKMRALYQMKDLENRITQDVEEQWREVVTRIEVVLKNKRIEVIEGKKLQEEIKKYKTGRSSSDIVTRFQEDYLIAQRAALQSLFNYRAAVLALRLAQNTLLP